MIKVLNLYAGIGGNRKLWNNVDITAIEINEKIATIYKNYYPEDNVIVGDAHEYLVNNYMNFDFIWSSPPCPSHSAMRQCGVYRGQYPPIYPEMTLYQEIIFLKYYAKKQTKWVVENVKPFYNYLINPTYKVGHNCFWTNFYISKKYFNLTSKIQELNGNETYYGFNIANEKIDRKNQILRNLVNPEIGLHLFNESQKKLSFF